MREAAPGLPRVALSAGPLAASLPEARGPSPHARAAAWVRTSEGLGVCPALGKGWRSPSGFQGAARVVAKLECEGFLLQAARPAFLAGWTERSEAPQLARGSARPQGAVNSG